jgi:hypothetical protein
MRVEGRQGREVRDVFLTVLAGTTLVITLQLGETFIVLELAYS